MRAKDTARLGAAADGEGGADEPRSRERAGRSTTPSAAGHRVAHQAAAGFDRAVPEGRPRGSRRQGDGGDHRRWKRTCRPRSIRGDRARRRRGHRGNRRNSPKDLGKVMKAVMPSWRGGADGRTINEIVRRSSGSIESPNLSAIARTNELKGTHKPLIHPPLGPCRRGRGPFLSTPVSANSTIGRPVRDAGSEPVRRARRGADARGQPAPTSPRCPTRDELEDGPIRRLIGIATMASRVLGVARETVLAGMFGAGDARNGRLQRRIPGPEPAARPVRRRGDDGGVRARRSRARLTTRGPRGRLAARQPRHQRPARSSPAARRARRSSSPRPITAPSRRDFAAMPASSS